MSVVCAAPDLAAGVAERLTGSLACQAQALGQDGFQALSGSSTIHGLLSGGATLFVALIGYRLLLGHVPSARDGVGWIVRLAIVLTLVTSWPAFQALVYRVATDGPDEIAGIIVPTMGVDATGIDGRIQQAYDAIRLGARAWDPPAAAAPSSAGAAGGEAAAGSSAPTVVPPTEGPQPSPVTASLFVVGTSGLLAASRMAAAFLCAVAPIAFVALLFDGTRAVFDGWVRALLGAALATVAIGLVTLLEIAQVEAELVRAHAFARGEIDAASFDPQAVATVVAVFLAVSLGAALAAVRVAGAFSTRAWGAGTAPSGTPMTAWAGWAGQPAADATSPRAAAPADQASAARSTDVADALAATMVRERRAGIHGVTEGRVSRPMSGGQTGDGGGPWPNGLPAATTRRRSAVVKSGAARRRDVRR